MEEIIELIKSTPNDMELGSKVRHLYGLDVEKPIWIYESPDKGRTIYRRMIGTPHLERELIKETLSK